MQKSKEEKIIQYPIMVKSTLLFIYILHEKYIFLYIILCIIYNYILFNIYIYMYINIFIYILVELHNGGFQRETTLEQS